MNFVIKCILTEVMRSVFNPDSYTQDAWRSCSNSNFRRVRKIVESDHQVHHVCPSVCPHGATRLPYWTDFHDIWHEYFSKIRR